MLQARLFEDDVELESELADVAHPFAETTAGPGRHLLIGLGVGAGGLVLWLLLSSIFSNAGTLTLAGERVAQLRLGDAVLLNGEKVGEVQDVAIRDGVLTARLRIDPEVLPKVPSTSRFEVGLLNRALPDGVGVRIVTAGQEVGATLGSDWESVRERLADQSTVPTGKPLVFYVVLFVVVAVSIMLLCLVIKVLKSTAFWTAVFVALLVVVLHAWQAGKLDDTARRAHQHLTTLQGTGQLTH